MMGKAWIDLTLRKLDCSQKELAIKFGVSPAQISKWKNGEHMSHDMENRFRDLTGIGDFDPEFVIWSGSLDNAIKWKIIIIELAELAVYSAETGYETWPLQDDSSLLCWKTFHTLRSIGVEIPDISIIDTDNLKDDNGIDTLLEEPCVNLILRIFKSLNDVFGFFAAYVSELINDDKLDVIEEGMEIEACLMSLAATKIENPPKFATRFHNFKKQVVSDYEGWLRTVQSAAFQAGVPIRAELMDLVYQGHDSLGNDAEAESLGINDRRLHPDIYMNELISGMRAIHQILPVIINKLGITPEELSFNRDQLTL